MTERDTAWPAGTPCWTDLMTTDLASGRGFYEQFLGWDLQSGGEEAGGYLVAHVRGLAVAGLGQMDGPQAESGMPPAWVTYFATDDAAATAAKITEAGGQVVVPNMDVMGIGEMGIYADSTGGVFGLWQAKTFTGAQLANEPGSFTWNELMTRDFDGAKQFYSAVFGHTFTDMSAEGFQYASMDLDGRPVGGLGGLPAEVPAEVPAHWRVYFSVDATDVALDTVVKLGGSVLRPASDSPYGRMADVADPQGAMFSVIEPPAPQE
jgi:predicted enzyme related to lactoylglutathione lyase